MHVGASAQVASRIDPTLNGAGRTRLGVRIAVLLRLVIPLLLVANLGRFPLLDSGRKEAPILFNDLIVVALLAAATLVAVRNRRLQLDGVALLGICFASIGAASALLAVPRFGLTGFEVAFSLAYLARWLVYFGIYLVVINYVRNRDVESTWSMLEATVLVFAGFGIVQSAFLPGFAQMVYPESVVGVDWDAQGHRLVSTFLDPNYAGMFILIGLLVMSARLAHGVPVSLWKPLVLFTALVLTLSRGSALAFLVGGAVILLARGSSWRLWRFLGVVAVLLLPAIPFLLEFASSFNRFSVSGSAIQRVLAWARGLEVLLDNPIIGVGFNTFGFVQEQYGFNLYGAWTFGLDGGLLFIAVLTGLTGLTVYTGMIYLVIRRCRALWRAPERSAEERGLALGVAAVTIALLVHALFLGSLLYPFLMEPIWIVWGLTFVLARSAPSNADRTLES